MPRRPGDDARPGPCGAPGGAEIAAELAAGGSGIVATGDMGIGNTTAAAALCAALLPADSEAVSGRYRLDDAGLARKVETVRRALTVNAVDAADPVGVLASVGGFELAVLAGVCLGAAAEGCVVLLDGFVTGAAALVAARLAPAAAGFMVASHRSPEPGHALVLTDLGLRPLLDLGLRLGEERRSSPCRSCTRRWRSSPTWPRSTPRASRMPARSLRAVAAAIAFLTRIPVGRLVLDADDVARGAALFPLVGAGIGAAVGATAAGLDGQLTVLLAAAAAVTLEALLTGAIHLDALADTADGRSRNARAGAGDHARPRRRVVRGDGACARPPRQGRRARRRGRRLASDPGGRGRVRSGAGGPTHARPGAPYARPGSGSGLVLVRAARASLVVGIALALGISVAALGLRGPSPPVPGSPASWSASSPAAGSEA